MPEFEEMYPDFLNYKDREKFLEENPKKKYDGPQTPSLRSITKDSDELEDFLLDVYNQVKGDKVG